MLHLASSRDEANRKRDTLQKIERRRSILLPLKNPSTQKLEKASNDIDPIWLHSKR